MGVEFEDLHYEQGDAPDFDRSAWNNVKPTLGLPFPNLPYLIDGEAKITEANAIMKYLAAKHGSQLLGIGPEQIAKVEMLAGVIYDLKMALTMPCYTTGDRPGMVQKIHQKVPSIVVFMGDNAFLAGAEVTYIDFTFFELCELMEFISEG